MSTHLWPRHPFYNTTISSLCWVTAALSYDKWFVNSKNGNLCFPCGWSCYILTNDTPSGVLSKCSTHNQGFLASAQACRRVYRNYPSPDSPKRCNCVLPISTPHCRGLSPVSGSVRSYLEMLWGGSLLFLSLQTQTPIKTTTRDEAIKPCFLLRLPGAAAAHHWQVGRG